MAKRPTESRSTNPAATTDDYALAVLYCIFGLTIQPFRGDNNRVAFRVYGDVEEAQRKIYSNTPVGCLDFVKELKLVRSLLFTTR